MSMKPGATTSAAASMTRAAFSGSRGATAAIVSPAMATSAFTRAAPEPSMTVPFLMSSDQDMRQSSDAAWPRAGIGFREMRVHDPPFPPFAAEHHGGAGDELLPLVVNVARGLVFPHPLASGLAAAPDHGHLCGDDAADVERRPIGALDVVLVEGPQPTPMVGAIVGVTIEIEECRFLQLAPHGLYAVPVEVAIGDDVFVQQPQKLRAVVFGTADELCIAQLWLGHASVSGIAMYILRLELVRAMRR